MTVFGVGGHILAPAAFFPVALHLPGWALAALALAVWFVFLLALARRQARAGGGGDG